MYTWIGSKRPSLPLCINYFIQLTPKDVGYQSKSVGFSYSDPFCTQYHQNTAFPNSRLGIFNYVVRSTFIGTGITTLDHNHIAKVTYDVAGNTFISSSHTNYHIIYRSISMKSFVLHIFWKLTRRRLEKNKNQTRLRWKPHAQVSTRKSIGTRHTVT